MQLHQLLEVFRKNNGFTQKEVANAIGVDKTTYAHYESGRRSPNTETLIKLAALFRISTDELLGVLPIVKRIQYNEDQVFFLEETLTEVKKSLINNSGDSSALRSLNDKLKSAIDPVFKGKMEQLEEMPMMHQIIKDIPEDTTVNEVQLDKNIERLLNEAIALRSELLSKMVKLA